MLDAPAWSNPIHHLISPRWLEQMCDFFLPSFTVHLLPKGCTLPGAPDWRAHVGKRGKCARAGINVAQGWQQHCMHACMQEAGLARYLLIPSRVMGLWISKASP